MIAPHGNILVNQIASNKQAEEAINSNLKTISISPPRASEVANICEGVFSPLTGFMNLADYQSVLGRGRLSNDIPFTIPINLDVSKEIADSIEIGDRILLKNNQENIAFLDVEEKYLYSKKEYCQKIFGTADTNHPGVGLVNSFGDVFLAGKTFLIKKLNSKNADLEISPAIMRNTFKEKKLRTITGFQTRNVPHRAHEYLQRIGLETTDALLIHPLVGTKKIGDFKPDAIIHAYQTMISQFYPQNHTFFSVLNTPMRYAGPKEALFHAIIRQNFGCTHFIVGRDHAGVGGFYDKYASQKIFDQYPDLKIIPLKLEGPFFCKKCDLIVTSKTCRHNGADIIEISGTQIRNSIENDIPIPQYIMRKEISSVLNKKSLIKEADIHNIY